MRNRIRRAVLHVRRWNVWRKMSLNGLFYKFLVLVGFVKSPSFPLVFLPGDRKSIEKALAEFERGGE